MRKQQKHHQKEITEKEPIKSFGGSSADLGAIFGMPALEESQVHLRLSEG
jgi:hypothetical protein